MSDLPMRIWAYSDPDNGWYEDALCTQGGSEYIHKEQLLEMLEGLKMPYHDVGVTFSDEDEIEATGYNRAIDAVIEKVKGS